MTENQPTRLPPKVYRRRRLMVLLIAAAVIAVIALVIWQPGSTSNKPSSDADAGVKKPVSTSEPETSASTDAVPTCDPKLIVVSAITDKATYAAGEKPQLSMSITNTGSETCLLNVGTSKQSFSIMGGNERYWASTDCQKEPSDQRSPIESGRTVQSATPLEWDRTRSDTETCDSSRDPVPAAGASYHLTVSLDGIKSTNTKQFVLE